MAECEVQQEEFEFTELKPLISFFKNEEIETIDDKDVSSCNEPIIKQELTELKQEYDDFNYEDFECKNEVDLKTEQVPIDGLNISQEMLLNSDPLRDSKEEQQWNSDVSDSETAGLLHHDKKISLKKYKCEQCPYESCLRNNLQRHVKIHLNIRDYKCTYCLKEFSAKRYLDNHLLKVHKCKDGITSKILKCDICNYETTAKIDFLRHKLKHGIKDNAEIIKCEHCTYETFIKNNLIKHAKIHQNMGGFVCSYCSKTFLYKQNLDNHLLKIHNSRDNVTSKIYECDKCSFKTALKKDISKHKLIHGIKKDFKTFKCQQCSYETYRKCDLIPHMKSHKNIREFKCSYCSQEFTHITNLDNHLLRIHKSRDSITRTIYECNKCTYVTTGKQSMLRHKLKHGIKKELKIYKCQQCSYQTYRNSHLHRHLKTHVITRNFKCTHCIQAFKSTESLNSHLTKFHKCNGE